MSEKDDIVSQSKNHLSTGFTVDSQKYLPESPESRALSQQKEQEKEARRQAYIDELAKKYPQAKLNSYYADANKAQVTKQDAELAEYEKKKQDLAKWREELRLEVREIKRRKGIEDPKPKYTEPLKPIVPPPAASTGTGCVLVVIGAIGFIAATSLLPFFVKQLMALLY